MRRLAIRLSEPHDGGQVVRGGWGREGARSEERAEQRLAPGGRAALPLTRSSSIAALPLTRTRYSSLQSRSPRDNYVALTQRESQVLQHMLGLRQHRGAI